MSTEIDTQPTDTWKSGIRDAYRIVVEEVEQLRKNRRALNEKLEMAEAARDLLRALLDAEGADASDTEQILTKTLQRGRKYHKGSVSGEVAKRSMQILLDAGRPLQRSELLEKLIADGLRIEAKNPSRFVARILWENKTFTHVPKIGYWIQGEPLPDEAGQIR